MQMESRPGSPGTARRSTPIGTVMGFAIAVVATVIAAIGVVLPWRVKHYYASVLRWFRNLLMQNSRKVRKWALSKRWEWDSDESES